MSEVDAFSDSCPNYAVKWKLSHHKDNVSVLSGFRVLTSHNIEGISLFFTGDAL